MPLSADWLPVSTPLDPAEDPPGSLDPLGTLLPAERLAEILLPGFTVRMWRGRLLTIATVAAAVVRIADRDPQFTNAPRGLPGRDLAKTALLSGEPLTSANFLKGQAVNGPFGVIARLARQLELIDDEGHMGRNAVTLLIAWSDDEKLSGVLDEDGVATRTGAKWMSDTVKRTVSCVGHPEWPGPNHSIWEQLAAHIRPDRIGPRERRVLLQILCSSPVRRRMVELLKKRVDIYRQAWDTDGNRGAVERAPSTRSPRTCWSGTLRGAGRTANGWRISPACGRRKAGCMWPRCSILVSRRVVGWSMSARMTAQPVLDALMMAIWRRGRPQELLHHSDQGSQDTAEDFQRLLADQGIRCRMSRRGDCWDNAAMESFFSTLKMERVNRRRYRTRDEARADIFDYIERFYNPRRRHSTLGQISPMEFERQYGS